MQHIVRKLLPLFIILTGLFILPFQKLYAGTVPQQLPPNFLGKIYLGVFGGGGSVTGDTLSQMGSAYYSQSSGGPLAVDAFGKSNFNTPWFVGAHIGYQLPGRLFNNAASAWNLAPAAEFEGYYLGTTATGDDINNETSRVSEHDFHVKYPMNTRVFLINGVLSFNHIKHYRIHPYVGLGFGSALISVAGATSTQTSPPEPGINHYNAEPSDTSSTFAAQPKLGLRFDLTKNLSAFAEYRLLYIAATSFTFGSTVYASHVATSNWSVKMGPNYYNLATVGLQYTF